MQTQYALCKEILTSADESSTPAMVRKPRNAGSNRCPSALHPALIHKAIVSRASDSSEVDSLRQSVKILASVPDALHQHYLPHTYCSINMAKCVHQIFLDADLYQLTGVGLCMFTPSLWGMKRRALMPFEHCVGVSQQFIRLACARSPCVYTASPECSITSTSLRIQTAYETELITHSKAWQPGHFWLGVAMEVC